VEENDPRPSSFASSGFQKAKLPERGGAIVETNLFRDLAILDAEYGCPGEPISQPDAAGSEADEEIAEPGPGLLPPPSHRPTT
jgi:hypothetical protein